MNKEYDKYGPKQSSKRDDEQSFDLDSSMAAEHNSTKQPCVRNVTVDNTTVLSLLTSNYHQEQQYQQQATALPPNIGFTSV